jgi:hypothetical protein
LFSIGLKSCIISEGDFEIISDSDLEKVGIESPFPDDTWERDESGRIISRNDMLRNEGYSIEQTEWLNTKISFQNKSIKLKRLYGTFLIDEYVIFKDGVIGIVDDGLIKPLFYPRHSRLNIFIRDTFALIDQRVIFGIVRNVKIVDNYVYFVAERDGHRFNGRYRFYE